MLDATWAHFVCVPRQLISCVLVLQKNSVLRVLSGGMSYFRAYTRLTVSKDAPLAHPAPVPAGAFCFGCEEFGLTGSVRSRPGCTLGVAPLGFHMGAGQCPLRWTDALHPARIQRLRDGIEADGRA